MSDRLNIEERIMSGSIQQRVEGKKPLSARINPVDFWNMVDRLGARVEQDADDVEYVVIHTAGGLLRVFPNADVPRDDVIFEVKPQTEGAYR